MRRLFLGLALTAALPWASATAQTPVDPVRVEGLTAAQLFEISATAREAGDREAAMAIYIALAKDPDVEIRSEARFRHALMMAEDKKFAQAAVLYRSILDEKPDAQRIRIELAYVLAQMGSLGAAQRELRLAQAGGLPPEVARLIDQFTNALRAGKPYGGSIELAVAPDNNINRATRSETLDTIIAPFDLSEDGQAQSGIGLGLKGQAYFRIGIDKRSQVLVRLSGSADLYKKSQFNDVALGVQAGPEVRSGTDRITVSAGFNRRWFGGKLYSEIISVAGNLQHPMGKKALLTSSVSISDFNNLANDLQDGTIYATSLGYERAFSNRFGAGITIGAVRQALADPGYANASGSVSLFAFREVGKTTLVGSLGFTRLEADQRLFLFPERRTDNRYSATIAATFRQLTFKGFAPLLRLEYERNESTVGLYQYDRKAAAIGLTRAF